MVALKRTEIPLDEEQFQKLLREGLITPCSSEKEKLYQMMGLSIEPDRNEIPQFEVDKKVIIDLLQKAKFSPEQSLIIKLDVRSRHFVTANASEINVARSGMYIKVLHTALITEIGFYFESKDLEILQKNLANDFIEQVDKDKHMVRVPFFQTLWSKNKNEYKYANINMEHFRQWLGKHFSQCNVAQEIKVMLHEYEVEIKKDNFQEKMINYEEARFAVSRLNLEFSPIELPTQSNKSYVASNFMV
jgi:hypothetical protein